MPRPRFLADMNISPLTVEQLRRLDWDIMRVDEIMDKKSNDYEILTHAGEQDRVIITQDLDFSLLLALGKYKKPSVINLRLEDNRPDNVTNRIIEVTAQMESELQNGIVVSVDEISARYRSLPIV